MLFEGNAEIVLETLETVNDFPKAYSAMEQEIEDQKKANKLLVEGAPKREQKRLRESLASEINDMEYALTVIGEAIWLTEKFGAGQYADIPGLCKIASREDIKGKQDAEKSSWSLTPGVYVGVPPVEDDGVDFHERMHEIHEELLALQAESNELMTTISKNFKEMSL